MLKSVCQALKLHNKKKSCGIIKLSKCLTKLLMKLCKLVSFDYRNIASLCSHRIVQVLINKKISVIYFELG